MIDANQPDTFATEVLASEVPVIVDFWAPWCGPCRMVGPELEAVAQEYAGRAKVVKVNVDENPEVAARYGVQGIPMIGLFSGGEMKRSVVGARPRHAIVADLGLAFFAPAKSPS
jgi:thioredoxin 1